LYCILKQQQTLPRIKEIFSKYEAAGVALNTQALRLFKLSAIPGINLAPGDGTNFNP
jgi:hypothetical protein